MSEPKPPRGVMVNGLFLYHFDYSDPDFVRRAGSQREDAPRDPIPAGWGTPPLPLLP